MSKKLRELQAKKATLVTAMRAITDKAAAESREPTDEEIKAFDAHKKDLDAANAAIEREQTLIAAEAALEVRPGAKIDVSDNIEQDPKLGFKSFGEFAASVRSSSAQGAQWDSRFAAVPSVYSNESIGQDGGFLVPPEFSREIFRLSLEDDNLLPLTDNVDVTGNSMVFPKDETTPWGTDGAKVYWENEASEATQTKMKLGTSQLRLNKLLGLVPVTDELMEDAGALGGYLTPLLADSVRWKTNEAVMFGTGAGQPAGAFGSAAVVTVAKETGQATATLMAMNLAKMVSRLPPGSYKRAVWMINNDVLPALFTLVLGDRPIYVPASEGFKGSPYGSLLGRPIMVSQHAKSFSSEGDVLLADWKYYRSITKAGGIQTATSMHLFFDTGATAFRVTFRVDGKSKISAAINPANGSATLSPFIKLGAR